MRSKSALLAMASVAVLTSWGCGCGCGGGGTTDGVKQGVADDMTKAADAAKRVDGNWDKLKPEEQKLMIKLVGDEESAKERLKLMAHPPNEQYTKKK